MTQVVQAPSSPAGPAASSRRAGPLARRRRLRRAGWWLAGAVIVIGLWQLAAVIYLHSSPTTAPSHLPEPSKIVTTVYDAPSTFFDALGVTLKGAVIGLAFGVAIGVVLGLASAASRPVEAAVYPYLVVSQMVPTIVLAPIILAIVKNGELARIIVAAFISFFVVAINMTRGLKNVEPDQLTLLRSVCGRRRDYFLKLRLPASLPFLFTGLKVAAPLSIVGEVVVELTGAQNGLGLLMLNSLKYGDAQIYQFWSAALLNALLGYALFQVVVLLERWLTPWQPEFRSAR